MAFVLPIYKFECITAMYQPSVMVNESGFHGFMAVSQVLPVLCSHRTEDPIFALGVPLAVVTSIEPGPFS